MQGVGIGVLVSLLFSVVPLLHVRFVKPSLLLRDETTSPADATGSAWRRWSAWRPRWSRVAVWQAASLRVGLIVCAGFAGLAVVLHLAGRGLVALVAPLANSRSFPLRHAVLHLSRPGQSDARHPAGRRSRRLLHRRHPVAAGEPARASSRSRCPAIRRTCSCSTSRRTRSTACARSLPIRPTARARPSSCPFCARASSASTAARPRRGSGPGRHAGRCREAATAAGRERSARQRAGAAAGPGPRVHHHLSRSSRGERAHRRRHLLERVRRPTRRCRSSRASTSDSASTSATRCASTSSAASISARVTSIRDVDWRDSRNGGFMFVFRPGVLEQAPQTFVAPLKGPDDAGGARPVPARSGRAVSERVGDRFPRDSGDGPRRHVRR